MRNKVRDCKTDYKSAAKFHAIKCGKDSIEKPLKDSVGNPNNT